LVSHDLVRPFVGNPQATAFRVAGERLDIGLPLGIWPVAREERHARRSSLPETGRQEQLAAAIADREQGSVTEHGQRRIAVEVPVVALETPGAEQPQSAVDPAAGGFRGYDEGLVAIARR